MSLNTFLRRLSLRWLPASRKRTARSDRPRLEELETRCLLAEFVVTAVPASLGDPTGCGGIWRSFAASINNANQNPGPDTIVFRIEERCASNGIYRSCPKITYPLVQSAVSVLHGRGDGHGRPQEKANPSLSLSGVSVASQSASHRIPSCDQPSDGIYDIARNTGYVVVGIAHETASFVAEAIRSWWLCEGKRNYPGATRLTIEADCGGGNSPRVWEWRVGLQRLADEFGLTITVGHFPQGASKWNLIEHRMFNPISANWAGEPLVSYEVMLQFIRGTRSRTGFRCRAVLDKAFYATKVKVSKEEKARVRMTRHRVLPHWNYTIRPNPPRR